jgi:hypothetical protein
MYQSQRIRTGYCVTFGTRCTRHSCTTRIVSSRLIAAPPQRPALSAFRKVFRSVSSP